MNAPRDHHFIPVFYLSQWAGSDGKLIEFTRKYDKLIPKSVGPRSTGYETDLYQFPDLPQDLRNIWRKYFSIMPMIRQLAHTGSIWAMASDGILN
jgi:hypothetical protein